MGVERDNSGRVFQYRCCSQHCQTGGRVRHRAYGPLREGMLQWQGGRKGGACKDTINCPEKVMEISDFEQTNQRILSML